MMREEVELCSHCMGENIIKWDVEKDGYEITCQHCGEKIMLCDACLHSDDNPTRKCDWSEEGCWRKRIRMLDRMDFTQTELQLLYAACMSYGNKLYDMTKEIPNEETIMCNMRERAKESWNLASKITWYMEDD